MKTPFRILVTTIFAAAALAGCKSTPKKTPPPPPSEETQVSNTVPTGTGRYTVESLEKDPCLRQRAIYFDFDKTEIQSEFHSQVACHAEYLRQFPNARMRLEGNADERGTRDYNQGLGERRGNAVSSALTAAGASVSQVNVVSYGEERPVCREHNESCWQKNRRVDIVYTSKQ
jgi:peptidoglycan-associated lipoprotein